MLVWKN